MYPANINQVFNAGAKFFNLGRTTKIIVWQSYNAIMLAIVCKIKVAVKAG